jgi:hypothetical protein
MTKAVPEQTLSATRELNAKKLWERPTLSQIASREAENSANPGGVDGVFTTS